MILTILDIVLLVATLTFISIVSFHFGLRCGHEAGMEDGAALLQKMMTWDGDIPRVVDLPNVTIEINEEQRQSLTRN